MKESPIFVKSFETLVWILDHTRKYPAHQRFVMAKRIQEAALDFQDCLVLAARTREREAALQHADFHLGRLRLYNRLAHQLQLASFAQYEFLARALDELGRLLGGWQRKARSSPREGRGGVGEA